MATNDDLIRQMYEKNHASTKTQLETDYNAALGDLDSQKAANQQAAAKAVTATKTEADRAAVAGAEYAAASGLSSGARAQARMARDNQLANDLTAIRTAQMDADAEIERKRGLLAEDYAAAIRKAQADNDLALAEALYKEAQKAEESLRADQRAVADLLAQAGDFTRFGQIYGLTADEIATLKKAAGFDTVGGNGGGAVGRAVGGFVGNEVGNVAGTLVGGGRDGSISSAVGDVAGTLVGSAAGDVFGYDYAGVESLLNDLVADPRDENGRPFNATTPNGMSKLRIRLEAEIVKALQAGLINQTMAAKLREEFIKATHQRGTM